MSEWGRGSKRAEEAGGIEGESFELRVALRAALLVSFDLILTTND